LKFGTELLQSPYSNYSPSLQKQYLESYDLGSIYAFDNLILNVDRRTDKPNLLFKSEKAVLIDHELTLATAENTRNKLINNNIWAHNYKRHIFHEVLTKIDSKEKDGWFDEFAYYLRDLINMNFIDQIHDQLSEVGHPVSRPLITWTVS